MNCYKVLTLSSLLIILTACGIIGTTPTIEFSSPTLTSTKLDTNNMPTEVESSPTASSNLVEGQKLVQELLENNGGCKLPCWWGITPGKTTWVDARKVLEPVSLFIGGQESSNDFYASVKTYLPYPYDFAKYMEHLYGVKNGVVDYIRVYNFDLAPNYRLASFLETYGQPTEIWMRTYSKAEMGIQNYTIGLFYQDNGMLTEYSTGDPLKVVDGKLQNCLIKEMDSPFIHLWSPEDQRLSPEYAKMFLVKTLPEPMPLLEATGMDIKTFYETFKNSDTDVCLETLKDLWP